MSRLLLASFVVLGLAASFFSVGYAAAMNKMDTALLRHELQSLIDSRMPQYEVQRIARRAIQFIDQAQR